MVCAFSRTCNEKGKRTAIGVDDDKVRVNMDPKDSFSVANEISEYIKQNSFDLIITGRESIDYNGGLFLE